MNYVLSLSLFPFYFLNKNRALVIGLAILAVSVSPRIGIGGLEYGRALELRYEDFLLILIAIAWFLSLCVKEKRIYGSVILKPLLIYISLATVSTFFGILTGWIEPVTALFYYLKEIQYFLIFFIIINFIKDYEDLKIATWFLLITGIANGSYVIYQILSGNFAGYYGVSTIGESSPFATGAYFSILFIFSLALFYFINNNMIKLTSVVSVLLMGIGLIGSASRVSIIGAVLAFFIFLPFVIKKSKKLFLVVFIIIIPVAIIAYSYMVKFAPSIERVTNVEHMQASLIDRFERYYKPLLSVVEKNPVFGSGKPATNAEKLPTEAHSHYLRILVEMGVLGLASFLYLILSIIRISFRVYKNSQFALGKVIGISCLLITISTMFAATVQDAFLPVKVNELFWIFVGLTMVVFRIESKNSLIEENIEAG